MELFVVDGGGDPAARLQLEQSDSRGMEARWSERAGPRGDRHRRRTSDERVLSLGTDDCAVEAEGLKAKGWCSSRNPGRMAYGGTDAVFDDSCGNLLDLHLD